MKSNFNENSSLYLHIADMKKNTALISQEEEIELAIKAKNGDKAARDKLVTSNMRFVITIARKYINHGLEFEDLISEGYLGLIEAVNHFDPEKGVKFISYAVWWIRQSITKALNDKGRSIRLPANKMNELNKIEKVRKEIKGSNLKNEEEELNEIASMLGMTKYHVREMISLSQEACSLDMIFEDEDSNSNLYNFLGDSVYDPGEAVLESSLKRTINETLATLDPRSAQIIKLRYGLIDGKECSLKEIGEKFQLSKERVRQIEISALKTLRKEAENLDLKDFVA